MKRTLLILLLTLVSCSEEPGQLQTYVFTPLLPGAVKSDDPEDENMVSDLNIFLYDWNSRLEEHRFLSRRFLGGNCSFEMKLLSGGTYTLCLAANMGYAMEAPPTLDSLKKTRFHLAYPDEYPKGIPMTGCLENFIPGEDGGLIPLRRMMARISVGMDRSALDDDVRIYVRRITVGNCPSSALLFGSSFVRNEDEVFPSGFCKADENVEPINRTPSTPVDLYLLENMGGENPSWIELDMEFHSDKYHTPPGEYLKYRFQTGDVKRNTSRSITVRPEGDGLNGMEFGNITNKTYFCKVY